MATNEPEQTAILVKQVTTWIHTTSNCLGMKGQVYKNEGIDSREQMLQVLLK